MPLNDIILPENKKVYFASDHHLGAPTYEASLPREKKFVAWLNAIQPEAHTIFLLGDLFDFWFEYKTVVPKGFIRVLGKFAELVDSGVQIIYFVGNHDLWVRGYFEKELNIPVYHKSQTFSINDTSFFIGHGDGLGPGDKGYKRMKKVFTHPITRWLFRWLHPDLGIRLGQYLSVKNRMISGDEDAKFLGEDKEWLALYAKRKLEAQHVDHFVFGHRHLPLEIQLNEKSKYTNLGDWIRYFTYAAFDGQTLSLEKWED